MDSLILILKYLFNKKNIECKFKSIDSFFEDGLSFPLFISIIFNIDEIPEINQSPATTSEKKHNNDLALQFLFQNNTEIQDHQISYENEDNQRKLLSLIFTKQCFKLDYQKIIEQCNVLIFANYESEKDFVKKQTLIALLQVLTDEEVQDYTDGQEDFKLLKENFEKTNVPFILDENSFKKQNQYQFYIQVEIIFDTFSDKLKGFSLFNEKDEDENKSIQKVSSSEISEDTINDEIVQQKKKKLGFFRFRKKHENSSESEDSTQYYSDEEDEKENEDLQNEALLTTINAIGSKGGIHYNDFEEAVKNDSIPKFVMFFFNIQSIEKVDLSNTVELKIESEHLTERQLNNIEAVLDFLKKKKEKFKILHFDFYDMMDIEASTILFYSNFLNCFFLKNLKQEMYQRTVRLLCTHTSRFKDDYNNLLFTKYKIYPCLLHFITKGDLHFKFNYHKVKFDDSIVEQYFKDANIPMIINKELLRFGKKYVSFPIFYQLQFIFDALDSWPKPRRIVELIASFMYELKNIKVPKIAEIALSIRAKRKSLILQKKIEHNYRKQNELNSLNDYSKKEIKIIPIPKTFSEICKEDPDYLTNLKNSIKPSNGIEKVEEQMNFSEYWNTHDPEYKNDNGIVYNETEFKNNRKQSQTDWINEITNIQKNNKKRPRKSLMVKKDEDMSQTIKFNHRRNNFESKLHKLFIYNEVDEIWEFNADGFKQFSEGKMINFNDSKTPLILYLNSNENELVSLNSNLINGLYPKIDEDQQIFVYALCDRSLTMLNYTIDFANNEKASIKPIFLLLHIPKSKENLPNVRLISTQIYSFLSKSCDFEITVLSKDHYMDQVEFIKDILMINRDYDDSNYFKKSPFSFVYQNPISTSKYYFSPNSNNENNELTEFIYKEPKFILLVNDQTVQFTNEIDENLNQNEFFINLKSQINKETHLHFINVDDPDTYECYLNCMNDLIMNKNCCLFHEIEKNLPNIKNCYFTEKYLQMITQEDYYYDYLRKELLRRLQMLSINKDKKSNDYLIEINKQFRSEISMFAPKDNLDFINKCYSIRKLFDHDDCCNESFRKILKESIQKCSDSYLNYISEVINQKYFWKIQQMADMIDSYKRFLKDELFSLIQLLISDDLIETAFEFNFDIIERQIEKDRRKIIKILQPFLDKIEIKRKTEIRDIRNTMKEGTNYTMKETENLREIKIAVKINQDLKSEIDQDF